MTDDFDELASAYLDGQVSDTEADRVEADPDLRARVSELAALSEALDVDVRPADEFIKRRHLATALEAFDELTLGSGPSPDEATAPVTDLAGHRADRPAQRPASRNQARRSGANGLPRWLGVAAALLAVVGGIGFLSQIDTGGDDDSSTEAISDFAEPTAAAQDTGAAELAGEGADDAGAEESADAESAVADQRASTDEAAAAPNDEADAGEESEADADDGDTTGSAGATTTTGGFFPFEAEIEEARVVFDAPPDAEQLAALIDGIVLDPELSMCAPTGELDGERVLGFVPVTIDGVDGEALFTVDPDDPTVTLLGPDCAPFG